MLCKHTNIFCSHYAANGTRFLESTLLRLKTFLQEPLINKLNRLNHRYYRLVTQLLYRSSFKWIGSGSVIYRPLFINNPQFISIGNHVTIRGGARLEVVRNHKNITPSLVIGDNTNIEQNVHIVCHRRIQIGANVSITGNCSIVDVTHPYENVDDVLKIGARILDEESFVEIGDGSFIGFGSAILPNVRIGNYVIIGTHSVVMTDIPDYSVAVGTPARVIKRYDPVTKQWLRVA